MRSNWSANSLNCAFFDRALVGFDVRKTIFPNGFHMTSWDESIHCEELYKNYQDYLSGMNLFLNDPETIPSFSLPEESVIIAFDLPCEYVNYLMTGSVSMPIPLSIELLVEGWNFLGFDIVDAITQSSALYGFDRSPVEWAMSGRKFDFSLNANGLIADCEVAVGGAIFFDQIIPEHAPFSPCGVWLKSVDK